MGDEIITNPVVLVQLAKDLAVDLKNIKDANETMSDDLKSLGASFQDDDYGKVSGCVNKIQGLINEALPEVKTVADKLIMQADLIKKQRDALDE